MLSTFRSQGDWGVVVVRLWAEESSRAGFRLRVLASSHEREPWVITVTDSIDEAVAAVARWLEDQVTANSADGEGR